MKKSKRVTHISTIILIDETGVRYQCLKPVTKVQSIKAYKKLCWHLAYLIEQHSDFELFRRNCLRRKMKREYESVRDFLYRAKAHSGDQWLLAAMTDFIKEYIPELWFDLSIVEVEKLDLRAMKQQ